MADRPDTAIHAAAVKVIAEQLRDGVSIGYVDAILDRDDAWKNATIDDLQRVCARIRNLYAGYLTSLERTVVRRG